VVCSDDALPTVASTAVTASMAAGCIGVVGGVIEVDAPHNRPVYTGRAPTPHAQPQLIHSPRSTSITPHYPDAPRCHRGDDGVLATVGNASSLHTTGRAARRRMEEARETLASAGR